MGDVSTAQEIASERLIVVLRGIPPTALDPLARALLEGGIRIVEVTLNSPHALEEIAPRRGAHGTHLSLGAVSQR